MFNAATTPITRLNITHLKDLLALQQKIITHFQDDEQHFILHRTAQDFLSALENPDTCVFGIFDQDKLVSQSILSLPSGTTPRELQEFAAQYPDNEIAIYKAVLVDPDYRGHGLMRRMLDVREQTAIMNGRRLAITQIAADNPASWINALRHGMKITKADFDPEDNAKVIYLQKFFNKDEQLHTDPAQNYALNLGQDVHHNVPALFGKLQHLTSKHYAGLSWDKNSNTIEWQKIIDDSQKHQHSFHKQEAIYAKPLHTSRRDYY